MNSNDFTVPFERTWAFYNTKVTVFNVTYEHACGE